MFASLTTGVTRIGEGAFMKVFGRIALLLVLCLSALAASGMLLPLIKEGASWSDLPITLGAVAGLAALGALWWWASGRSLRRAATPSP